MSVEATLLAGSVWEDVPLHGENTPALKLLVSVYLGTPAFNSELHKVIGEVGKPVHYYQLDGPVNDEPVRIDRYFVPIYAAPLRPALAALRVDRRVRGGYYHTLPAAVAALERLLNGPEHERIHVALFWS